MKYDAMIQIKIPHDLKEDFRKKCGDDYETMSSMMIKLVRDYLKSDK